MKRLLILFMFCICGSSLMADTLYDAEKAYQSGAYEDAIRYYDTLLTDYPTQAELRYNLATSYAQNKQYGLAVFHYLQLLDWQPLDADSRHNLSLVWQRVVDQSWHDQLSFSWWWQWSLRHLPATIFFAIFLISIFAVLLITLMMMSGKQFNRMMLFYRLSQGIALCAAVLLLLSFQARNQDMGVVVERKIGVYAGPSDQLDIMMRIHEGMPFLLRRESAIWLQIELPTGVTGWVKRDAVKLIQAL